MLVELHLTFLTEYGDVGLLVVLETLLTCFYILLSHTKSKCQFGFKNKKAAEDWMVNVLETRKKGWPLSNSYQNFGPNMDTDQSNTLFPMERKRPNKKHNQNQNPLIVFRIRIAQKNGNLLAIFISFTLNPQYPFQHSQKLLLLSRLYPFSDQSLHLFFQKLSLILQKEKNCLCDLETELCWRRSSNSSCLSFIHSQNVLPGMGFLLFNTVYGSLMLFWSRKRKTECKLFKPLFWCTGILLVEWCKFYVLSSICHL